MSTFVCPHCQKPMQEDANFCPACGRPRAGAVRGKSVGMRDHYVIWAVLAAAAVVFIALTTLGGKKQGPSGDGADQTQDHGTEPIGAPMGKVNMEAFLKNLPTDYAAVVTMGNALMDQGHYDLAVECYTRALQQKPDEADVRVDLGACQHFLGQNDAAIASFTEALKINPQHGIAKLNMGIACASTGDTLKAIDWWQKLLSENPPEELKKRTEMFLSQFSGNK